MMRAVLTVFLVLFISISAFSQEVIKEKVEIKPKTVKKAQGAESHTITVDFRWNVPERIGGVIIDRCLECIKDGTDQMTGGIYTYTMNAPSAGYWFKGYVQCSIYDNCISTLKVYLDGSLVVNVQGTCEAEGGFETPYYDYIYLTYAQDNLYSSNACGLGVFAGTCIPSPFPNYFNDYDKINMSIVSGSEYISLVKDHDYNNPTSTLDFKLDDRSTFELEYLKPNLTSDNFYAVIRTEVNGNSSDCIVCLPPAKFSLYTFMYDNVIYHNLTTRSYIAFHSEDNTSPPTNGITLSATIIQGSKYGVLVDPMTGDRGASLAGVPNYDGSLMLNFEATGENVTAIDTIIVRLVPSSPTIEPINIQWIIAPSPMEVTIVPNVLAPGDTADVVIKQKNLDGSVEDFPYYQTFEVSVSDGCDGGELLVENELGNHFSYASQPIKFVASDSLSSDSLSAQIRVGYFKGGGGPAGKITEIKNKAKKTVSSVILKKIENFEKLLAEKKKAKQKTADESSCYAGDYYSNIFSFSNAAVESKPVLEIIRPTKDSSPELISSEPKMPTITCQAKLNNYTGGRVRFEWEYGVSYELKRTTKCSRTGSIVFKGTTYSNNSDITEWIVPFQNIKNNIKYLSFVGKEYLNANSCSSATTEWNEGEDIFIGGTSVHVSVLAYNNDGNIIGSNFINPSKFLGENPYQSDIKAYIKDKAIWAIIEHESSWLQFETENTSDGYYNVVGMPRYGYPSGFGLMQIDNTPYATEMQLWNWKKNVDQGVSRFNDAKISAQKYLAAFGQLNIPTVVLMHEAYQNYNGTLNYYRWDNKLGWIRLSWLWKDDKETHEKFIKPNYADAVYNIFKKYDN